MNLTGGKEEKEKYAAKPKKTLNAPRGGKREEVQLNDRSK
jgi:hypothetical protein